MTVDKIFKYSFSVYRIVLIAIAVLSLFAKFIVGAAGHNTPLKATDYCFFAFTIATPLLLFLFTNIQPDKIAARNIIRMVALFLIAISVLFLFHEWYDMALFSQSQKVGNDENILVGILLLFIALSSIVFTGLIRNRI
ncbi:hypothetical protein [Flavobacterium sp. FlaQc-48]|uniref:hypothetical protein n=1 Tax=Flavobacterium sp. FlaQc-48 TaxID=3374181 RepID=UPI0037574990